MSAPQYPVPAEQPPEFLALVDALGGIAPPCLAVDPERWFDPDPEPAIRLCEQCHARQQCLDYARATDARFGVWGGCDLERRQQRRRPRRAAS